MNVSGISDLDTSFLASPRSKAVCSSRSDPMKGQKAPEIREFGSRKMGLMFSFFVDRSAVEMCNLQRSSVFKRVFI